MGYTLIITAMTWPWVWHLSDSWIGYLNVDALDTIALQGLYQYSWFSDDAMLFWPQGYDVQLLLPNRLDHVSMMLFAWLPFPLQSSMWWLSVMLLNALCAHRLGRLLEPRYGGWFVGMCFLLSSSLTREVSLHHAPQSMLFWFPLFYYELMAIRQGKKKSYIWAAVWLACASYTYWYFGAFLILSGIPLVWKYPKRPMLYGAALFGALIVPGVWEMLSRDAQILHIKAPQGKALLENSPGLDFIWHWQSPHQNAIVSIILILAALKAPKDKDTKVLWCIVLGAWLMTAGFKSRIADTEISLPLLWMREIHPFITRFHWPIRCDIVLFWALVMLAVRTPRSWKWLVFIVIESVLRVPNLPIAFTQIDKKQCVTELSEYPGVWLEMPFAQANFSAVHQRIHQQPLVNPLVLPPKVPPPKTWLDNHTLHKSIRAAEEGKAFDVDIFRTEGITGIYVVHTRPSLMDPKQLQLLKKSLTRSLGSGTHRSCMSYWLLKP